MLQRRSVLGRRRAHQLTQLLQGEKHRAVGDRNEKEQGWRQRCSAAPAHSRRAAARAAQACATPLLLGAHPAGQHAHMFQEPRRRKLRTGRLAGVRSGKIGMHMHQQALPPTGGPHAQPAAQAHHSKRRPGSSRQAGGLTWRQSRSRRPGAPPAEKSAPPLCPHLGSRPAGSALQGRDGQRSFGCKVAHRP